LAKKNCSAILRQNSFIDRSVLKHEFEQTEKLHFRFGYQIFVPALGISKSYFTAPSEVFVEDITKRSGNTQIFESYDVF
jgi:hypothetical protein